MDIIEILKYIFLGIIQGFTEPLPISSSGHMVIFSEIFNIGTDDINLEIIANAGSLIAIVFIYYKDIVYLVKNFFLYLGKKENSSKEDFQYLFLLLLAVLPAGIAGLLLKNVIETHLTTLLFVGIGLLITALALLAIKKEAVDNTNDKIGLKEAIMIGLFQVFALMPGISRSGSTMVGGLKAKVNFKETMRFSFLLYIPISLASLVVGLRDINVENTFVLGYVLAFLFSMVTTYFAVKLLFRWVQKGNLKYFSIYCFIVGIIVIIYNFI